MGTPNGFVNYFGGMDGMSEENMTQFDMFLNIGWDSLAGMRECFEQSEIGNLMLSHCYDAAPKAIRFYECLPMFKNLHDQSRYLIVAKSIMKVTLLAVGITLDYHKAPAACSNENFSIVVTQFPTLMVSQSSGSFYISVILLILFNSLKLKNLKDTHKFIEETVKACDFTKFELFIIINLAVLWFEGMLNVCVFIFKMFIFIYRNRSGNSTRIKIFNGIKC